jgi:putative RNA 2'-phosphotransferase
MSKGVSKFISLVLRHNPCAIGIELDEHGWADVSELINGLNKPETPFDMEMLEEIVATDEKGRYSFNEDKTKIRANQGHSLNVSVEMKEVIPPKHLYHGTATRFLESIKNVGLTKQSRQFVHLTDNRETAVKTGKRHGKPVVLKIDTEKMIEDNFKFFVSANGVYQVESVPFEYCEITKITE